jgi:hypothetical protein
MEEKEQQPTSLSLFQVPTAQQDIKIVVEFLPGPQVQIDHSSPSETTKRHTKAKRPTLPKRKKKKKIRNHDSRIALLPNPAS